MPTRPNGAKTHCPQGHPYDEANTKVYAGKRYCRTCLLARSREQRERRKAARTTAPGGVDGSPYDRPMADHEYEVNPEAGARQGDDDSLGVPPERYLPI